MKLPLGSAVLFASLAISSVSNSLLAQAAPTGSLLVLSKHDHTLAIVEATSLKVIAKVPVGNDPHEVIASTDGTTAYVSNYGSGAYNTLAVIDLIHHKAMPSVDLGPLRGPHGLTFVGGKTWFTSETAKAIGRYDPATNKVDWILGTGQNRIHMVYVSEDQRRIITTNVVAGTVSLIEQEAARTPPPQAGAVPSGGAQRVDWNQTVIPVGKGSEGFDLSPDKREIWVANAQDGTISVIDVAGKKVVETLAANVAGANRLKFTVGGKYVLVSMLKRPDLIVLDAATRKVVRRVPIGHGAAGILIQPDGFRAFVACTPDDYVAVIDLRSFKVTSHFNVGPEPDGMAWADAVK
jgi:YVTN family beta-propeller protein